MSDSASSDLRALVEKVCDEMRLGPFAANTVEQWVQSDPATWPDCCLSSCDPCNSVLRAAAKRVLEARPDAE